MRCLKQIQGPVIGLAALAMAGFPSTALAGAVPFLAHRPPATDRELISLGLGLCTIILVLVNWRRVVRMPGVRWWVGALFVRACAWTYAVTHDANGGEDAIEAGLVTISTALAAIAAWRTFVFPPEREPQR